MIIAVEPKFALFCTMLYKTFGLKDGAGLDRVLQ